MAILYAASHPERVHGLVLYSSYARRLWAPDYPWGFRADERARYAVQLEQDWAWEADMRRMCPNADEELARWWGERCRAATSPGAARALIEMASLIDVRDVLGAVQAPTLVLHRRDDLDCPRRGGPLPRRAHPGRSVRRARRHRSLRRRRPGPDPRSGRRVRPWPGVAPRRPTRRSRRCSPYTSRSPSTRRGCAGSCEGCSTSTAGVPAIAKPSGVLATFDGPGRAVRCGLALVRAAPRPPACTCRSGLHTAEIARRGAAGLRRRRRRRPGGRRSRLRPARCG